MPENQITSNFVCLTSSNFVTISHINYWDQVNSSENIMKFWNGSVCRNNQDSAPYSMLQHIGRAATPKLVPRNCFRYLQTTVIIGEGDWSQNICDVWDPHLKYSCFLTFYYLIFRYISTFIRSRSIGFVLVNQRICFQPSACTFL